MGRFVFNTPVFVFNTLLKPANSQRIRLKEKMDGFRRSRKIKQR